MWRWAEGCLVCLETMINILKEGFSMCLFKKLQSRGASGGQLGGPCSSILSKWVEF